MAKNNALSKPGWLEKLEAESWEAELLVSGVAIYGTLQLPPLLRAGIDWAVLNLAEEYQMFCYYIFWFLIICTSVLIINFIMHFILRALWIGMIGLVSVFPKGVNRESTIYSQHFLQQLADKFDDPTVFNQKLDRICSQVFAFSFAFVLGFIAFDLIALLFLLVTMLLKNFIPGLEAQIVLIVLFALLVLPGLFSAILNSKSLREKKWVQRIHFPFFVNFYSRLVYHVFYEPISYILYIFVTNLRLKKVGINLVLYFFLIMFVAVPMLLNSNALYFLNDTFYTMGYRDEVVKTANYETYHQEGTAVLRPMIPSEAIEGPFIRLYIPVFEREQEAIREYCPETEPPADLSSRAGRQWKRKKRLNCLAANYYRIEIDGRPLDSLDFYNYEYPGSPGSGVLTYLSTEGLSPGDHQLHLVYPKQKKEEHTKEFYIPFWFGAPR